MGLGTRRHILPAPTESSILESAEDTGLGTDLATDISRRTDRTSQTIPEDGSPITVTTGTKHPSNGKLTKRKENSQTSLLIEYYEGGKGSDSSSRQPSVRVRVTPSGSRKSKGIKDGHIVVTEAGTSRKPSYSRKISLNSSSPIRTIDPGSVSSLEGIEHTRTVDRAPVDIEVLERGGSDLSGTSVSKEARYIVAPSDISSMPPDSLIGAPVISKDSRAISNSDTMAESSNLAAPLIPQNRNASTERFQQKVIEKLSNKPRVSSGGKRRHSEKSRSRSASHEIREVESEERRRSGRTLDDEGSNPTNSMLSAGQKSIDQVSYRSGASQSSLTNNPKLLRTVEDAIRRLIMPELEEIKKKQKTSPKSSKYEREASEFSESSVSREEVGRNNSSGSKRRHRRRKEADLNSPSERSYRRRESVESLSADEHRSRSRHDKSSHRARDAAAAALAGGALTAMALKHHGSQTSLEREERRRRRRRSKSRSSRSTSVADPEDVFHKHDVPPMPMRSEISSEVTRSSLLSSKTGDTMTPTHREFREVVRGSPREASSPASETPTKTPVDLRRALGTHHGNLSERDLRTNRDEEDEEAYDDDYSSPSHGALGTIAAGGLGSLAAHELLNDPERARKYESNLHHQHPIRRGLSPIQSVASYTTTEPNRNSIMQPRSIESMDSIQRQKRLTNEISIDSLSSAPSTDVARSKRPAGINLENRSEVMGQHDDKSHDQPRQLDDDGFFDEQHSQNERYRDSFASDDPNIDVRHMTNYTDDSMDVPYLDKVTAGQQVARGYGANPEYIHTPAGVESAVASLYEPSLLSSRRDQSPAQSYTDSMRSREIESPRITKQGYRSEGGSPLKEQYLVYSSEELPLKPRALNISPQQSAHSHKESTLEQRALDTSPPHSEQRSFEEKTASEHIDAPTPGQAEQVNDAQTATSPESEITTNPSFINGPIGGLAAQNNRDRLYYDPTPPQAHRAVRSPQSKSRDIGLASPDTIPGMMGAGLAPTMDNKQDIYSNDQVMSTPPGGKADEGYVTGDNPRSPLYSPRPRDAGIAPANVDFDDLGADVDPFTTKRERYMSGLSQGMTSPLYDSATGKGLDRIQSKDIVALMDHLTVRDAQRNARDTEILVTLVRSAAEMRNSFEDMKKFIAEQDDLIMDTADMQHEKTQKIIGGPRPQPVSTAHFTRSATSEEGDPNTKRRNVFKRALQGLGSKNTKEIQNIEQMLMHLLGEVEGLRNVQEGRTPATTARGNGSSSADNVRAPTDNGYEPEGQAGTSSTGDRSGFFSNNSSRQADYRDRGLRRESGNRVSTVLEGDEYEQEEGVPNEDEQFRGPNRDTYDSMEAARATVAPTSTPPRMQQQNGALSAENTPHMTADSSGQRKHKSTASSFLPRISRWSKTTASSVVDNFRSSNQNTNKSRPYSEMSRSGTDLGEYDYDPQGEDRLRSNTSFANEQHQDQENRPPSPLIPSQLSEKPKYQAHRNSQNLQHPQPRQGPTDRYQHHLETEAVNYGQQDQFSPTSQTSSQWDSQGALGAIDPNVQSQQPYTGQGHLSPIRDDYSETSSAMMQQNRPSSVRSGASVDSYGKQGPPRPPKIRDEDPLVPQRPPKVAMTPPGNRQTTYVDHVAAARAGSPALDKSPVAALRSSPAQGRKPSGPRPITSSGGHSKGPKGDLNTIKRTRFRGSPNHIESSEDEVAY